MKISNRLYTLSQAKDELIKQVLALDLAKKPDVFRLEIRIKPIDQIAWLSAQSHAVKIYGSNQDDQRSIAGIGVARSIEGSKPTSFKKIFSSMRHYLSSQYPNLQWYGGIAFDRAHYQFVLPCLELARDHKKMILACNIIGKVNKKQLIDCINQMSVNAHPQPLSLPPIKKRLDLPKRAKWDESVNIILKAIKENQCQKVVLARQTVLSFKEAFNPWVMLAKLKIVTPRSYHFAFQFDKEVFLGASPERLYQRQGQKLATQALAGTLPPGKPSRQLLASLKDRHEHDIVVKAIAAALAPLVKAIDYPSKPGIIKLASGSHLNTPFKVLLKPGVLDEDILDSLHPTPALGGMPRPKALGYIKRIEQFQRGWYGGPVGYVGLDWVEFVVGIRSALAKGCDLTLYAGAGIVDGSDPAREWDEIEHKIGNFQKIVTR